MKSQIPGLGLSPDGFGSFADSIRALQARNRAFKPQGPDYANNPDLRAQALTTQALDPNAKPAPYATNAVMKKTQQASVGYMFAGMRVFARKPSQLGGQAGDLVDVFQQKSGQHTIVNRWFQAPADAVLFDGAQQSGGFAGVIGGSHAGAVQTQGGGHHVAGGSHAGAVRRHEISIRGVDGVPEGVGAVGDFLQVTTQDPSNYNPNAGSLGDLWIHAAPDYSSPHVGFALKDSTVTVIGDTLPGPGPNGTTAQWVNIQSQTGVQGWSDMALLTAAAAIIVPPPPAVQPVAPPMPLVPPAPPQTPPASPYTKPLLIGAGVLGVAALGFIVYKTKGKKGGLRRRVSHLRRRHA
jgi:hypothetical protein